MRRLTLVAASGLALASCETRRVTEADCALVRDRITAAWNRDAVAAMTLAQTEAFRRFVADEEKRIAADWMAQCQPLVGREISDSELGCLEKAQTIDDVSACAGR